MKKEELDKNDIDVNKKDDKIIQSIPSEKKNIKSKIRKHAATKDDLKKRKPRFKEKTKDDKISNKKETMLEKKAPKVKTEVKESNKAKHIENKKEDLIKDGKENLIENKKEKEKGNLIENKKENLLENEKENVLEDEKKANNILENDINILNEQNKGIPDLNHGDLKEQDELLKGDNKSLTNQDEVKIDKDKLKTIAKEIENNKKKLQSKNKLTYKIVLKNIIIAIIAIIYFMLLLLGSNRIPEIEFLNDMKTFIVFQTIATLVLFELAYKKDSDELALHGIEMLGFDTTTVILYHLNSRGNPKFNIVIAIICSIICAYYIIKSLIVFFKKNKKNK